jgi:glycosyltransferase involved in cell wall biosynthesis
MISIIIPTYNNVEGLKLCLRSCIEAEVHDNEIIIVFDTSEKNISLEMQDLLEHYKSADIKLIFHYENKGLPCSINKGVREAKYPQILIVNDDNVFPHKFDEILISNHYYGCVLSPNQIEPKPSIFKQFHIRDLGTDPEIFDLEKFWEYEMSIRQDKLEETGSTLPIFMNKIDFLKVGGWDENYDKSGVVCDWDFFLKCNLVNYDLDRTYSCNFYHFVSQSTPTPEELVNRHKKEHQEHLYAKKKWGKFISSDINNNLKYLI